MKIEFMVTSSIVPPAVSITLLMISSTWRVCAAASPRCTTLLSLSNGSVPETYTTPSARVPGTKGASGTPVPAGIIALLGIQIFLICCRSGCVLFRFITHRIAETAHVRHPAEESFDVINRRFLREFRACLMGGVFQHYAEILEEETVTQRGLNAHVGGDAGEDQMMNAVAAQQAVELSVEEPAVTRFWQHDIARLRLEFIHQIVIPVAFRQQFAHQFRTLTHGFQCVGFVEVR